VTNTTMMEETDYRGGYAASVMEDLVDRSGGAYLYFAFWDTTADEIRLFFDNDNETIGLSTISISNDWDDVDNDYIFAPDSVAKLAREADQTYSDVVVTYDRGAQKVYRYRPSTAMAYVRRGTEIQRPYTRGVATATAQGEKFLDKHAVEVDRITCSIQVPANRVGLIEAGQGMTVRFTHLPGYETDTVMRIVSYSPRPTNDLATHYDVALELVGAPGIPLVCSVSLGTATGVIEMGEPPCTTGASYPISLGITPATDSLLIAWAVGYDGDTPSAIDMSAITGYTTIVTYGGGGGTKATYTAAYKANAPAGVESVAAASYTLGYCLGGAQDPYGIAQAAIPTTASAPVQTVEGASLGTGIPFGTPPTPGNIVIGVIQAWATAYLTIDGSFWTVLAQDFLLTGRRLDIAIVAHCVELGEPNDYEHYDSTYDWIILSEWAISGTGGGGGSDTIIDLGPAPGATTTHTTDPTVTDDAAAGYTVGSPWVNTTAPGSAWVLTDSTPGAAVWVSTTATAPTTADYLVGTAQAGLSAEIVVGATPGGELGGTWASPTVDATHSGSAHHAHALNNLAATTDPAVTDDSGDGYAIGSRWINTSTDEEFVATDVTVGAAVWLSTTAAGAGSALTVADEGTPLATDATTLDFVGDGVVASGTGATKTITVPGVADILDLPTAEGDDALVLSPDGTGGVEFRTPTGGPGGAGFLDADSVGEIPYGTPPVAPVSGSVLLYGDYIPATTNLIPTMTSATAPSGVASDSEHYSNVPAWCAMGGSGYLSNGTGLPQWIQYQFTTAVKVVSYSIRPWWIDNYPSRTPKDWTLEGSNDGTNWTTIDTVTGWLPANSADYVEFVVDSPDSYAYYRLNVTANQGAVAYLGIGGWKMFGPGSTVALWTMRSDGTVQLVE